VHVESCLHSHNELVEDTVLKEPNLAGLIGIKYFDEHVASAHAELLHSKLHLGEFVGTNLSTVVSVNS
jgi:hypothetical protein